MDAITRMKNLFLLSIYKLFPKKVPIDHHISRYLSPSQVDKGKVLSSGFQYRKDSNGLPKENELSVNWLEYLGGASLEQRLERVRNLFQNKGFELRKNGRFSVLQIREMHDEVNCAVREHSDLISLCVKHSPTKNESKYDLSHCSILGIPLDEDGERLVSTTIANLATEMGLHPAKPE